MKDNGLNGALHSAAATQIQHLLDAMPYYALLVDSSHGIVAANRKLVQDLHLSPQQLVGSKCPLTVHGTDSPIADCPLVEALEKGSAAERDLLDSASARWIRATVFPTSLLTDDGRTIYLHFARDITETRRTEEKLAQSLEHHTALSELLRRFQRCQTGAQILDALITELLSLSWLGITTTALGFLATANRLQMAVQYNANPNQLARCKSVAFGDCLCGKAALSGRSSISSSDNPEHSFRYEGMAPHRHVVLPITQDGRTLGVVALYLRTVMDPNSFQMDFLNAAVSTAAAALSAQLAQDDVKRIRESSMAQVFSYQEEERKRLSTELHDQVCQSLSALLVEMQAHGIVDESLRSLRSTCENRIRGLIDEVREMAGKLRPAILDDYGLDMALARYIEDLSSSSGLAIDYQYVSRPENPKLLPAPMEIGLYRVATEALNNIVAHASASRASVILLRERSRLILLLEDDGRGFDYAAVRENPEHCRGLIGIEERIALMGGTSRIESTPGKGTILRAEIPVESATAE